MLPDNLSELGERVAVELERSTQIAPDLDVGELLELAALRREQARRKRIRTVGASALLAASGVFVLVHLTSVPTLQVAVGEQEQSYEVGSWASTDREDIPMRFSDGSEVVLAPKTRARVLDLKPDGARVLIESGSAAVSVVPREGSEWAINLGPFVVKVLGTEFDIAWDPASDKLELSMKHGSVSVSGCVFGQGRRVHSDETLTAWCKKGRYEIRKNEPEPTVVPEVSPTSLPVPAETAQPPKARKIVQAPVKSWQQLAEEGDYSAALKAARELGFEKQLGGLPAESLLRLGNVARYAGDSSLATKAYTRVRERFPGTRRAGIAAYSLARIAFDQQKAYRRAATWFGTYLSEQPGGSLAREALGRQVEALHRSGAKSSARSAARRYLATYPDGPHAPFASGIVKPNAR